MKLADFLSTSGTRPADLARRLGVPSSTITRLLRGERGASLGLALRIERATGGQVTPNDFMALDPVVPPPEAPEPSPAPAQGEAA